MNPELVKEFNLDKLLESDQNSHKLIATEMVSTLLAAIPELEIED